MITGAEYVIYIPCAESEALIRQYQQFGPSKKLLRDLGRYAVNVYETQFRSYMERGMLEQLSDNAAILLNEKAYDKDMGLLLENTAKAEDFII